MYAEFNKVNTFLKHAELLNQTDRNFKDIYELTFKRNANNKVCLYINNKEKLAGYTYKKMQLNILRFANYISLNIEKKNNNVIILKLSNSPHWGEVFYAILMAGFIPLLMDAKTSKDGVDNLYKQANACGIICDDANKYEYKKITLHNLLESEKVKFFNQNWANEVIFCSSGTTGDVKMMIFNGQNIASQICCSLNMPLETKDIMYPKNMGKVNILAMIPFHHIFGFVAVFLWYTYYGKTLLYPNSTSSKDIAYICQKGNVTHVYSVPLFWDSLAQSVTRKAELAGEEKKQILDKIIKYNLEEISKEEAGIASSNIAKNTLLKGILGSKVKYCISGGGYLNQNTSRIINGIGYPLYNGFGMTEIGVTSVELSSQVKERLKGAIGRPLFGVEYKIKPNDKGQDELLIKSPTIHVKEIIAGEIKNTQLDKDGFFYSGDIASCDENGKYYIKGRIKDIIINADGENIFPDEIEIYFKDLPHVINLCVLGISSKGTTNQKVVLALELDNRVKDEDIKELHNLIDERSKNLPHNTQISNIYLSLKKMPLANNMKVKRFLVRDAIENNTGEYVDITFKKQTKSFKEFDAKLVESIIVPLRKIFSEILILPEFKITDEGHWIDELGGDSMSYVELLQRVESEFDIKIPETSYGQLTNINDFVYEIATLKTKK